MESLSLQNNLIISKIALGTWGMGGDYFGKTNDTACIELIHQAFENGVNFIDTAPAYGEGHAERLLGKALCGLRNKVIISTKCGLRKKNGQHFLDLSRKAIEKDLHESLQRLKTDYIDIYFVHWPDGKTPLHEVIDTLSQLQQKGHIRAFGLSNYKSEDVDDETATKIIGIQLQNTLIDKATVREVQNFLSRDIFVFGYGVFGGGVLTGEYMKEQLLDKYDNRNEFYDYYSDSYLNKLNIFISMLKEIASNYDASVAQVLIAFNLCKNGLASCILGMRTQKHLKENLRGVDIKLHNEDIKKIKNLSKLLF